MSEKDYIYMELNMAPPRVTHQSKKIVRIGNHCKLANTTQLNEAVRQYKAALKPHAPESPLDGPIHVRFAFAFPYPSRTPKKQRETTLYKPTRPDWDNMAKTLQDAMTAVGFWYDDAQICSALVEKFYCDEPGIRIYVGRGDHPWSI